MADSFAPPLCQSIADDGLHMCTSSLRSNDCSGTADGVASAPDRMTSETAMSNVEPLEDLADVILSALRLYLQRKQYACMVHVIQANLASTKSMSCSYTIIQLLTVNSSFMIGPHDEQHLPSPKDWICTPDEDLTHGVMDEQADDNPTFHQPAEVLEKDTAPRPPRPWLVMPNKPALKLRERGETDLPVVLRILPSDGSNDHHGLQGSIDQ
ncbi:hypothetical protein J4E93_008291 [Alternaria ventricosa]|uniref:uncharacterized protein n=1 Tax=Alternaria ventricosa TaxID=1187951 RepID=UPI0020C562BF|nr:uncharacterized protein J4E93_008291 [Alternaria ventricosa]KAI4640701.1 hypothetical protein J4E93_008291 [Alternaria ventricosa]